MPSSLSSCKSCGHDEDQHASIPHKARRCYSLQSNSKQLCFCSGFDPVIIAWDKNFLVADYSRAELEFLADNVTAVQKIIKLASDGEEVVATLKIENKIVVAVILEISLNLDNNEAA